MALPPSYDKLRKAETFHANIGGVDQLGSSQTNSYISDHAWTSSDPLVATIAATGALPLVTPIKPGTTILGFTGEDATGNTSLVATQEAKVLDANGFRLIPELVTDPVQLINGVLYITPTDLQQNPSVFIEAIPKDVRTDADGSVGPSYTITDFEWTLEGLIDMTIDDPSAMSGASFEVHSIESGYIVATGTNSLGQVITNKIKVVVVAITNETLRFGIQA